MRVLLLSAACSIVLINGTCCCLVSQSVSAPAKTTIIIFATIVASALQVVSGEERPREINIWNNWQIVPEHRYSVRLSWWLLYLAIANLLIGAICRYCCISSGWCCYFPALVTALKMNGGHKRAIINQWMKKRRQQYSVCVPDCLGRYHLIGMCFQLSQLDTRALVRSIGYRSDPIGSAPQSVRQAIRRRQYIEGGNSDRVSLWMWERREKRDFHQESHQQRQLSVSTSSSVQFRPCFRFAPNTISLYSTRT